MGHLSHVSVQQLNTKASYHLENEKNKIVTERLSVRVGECERDEEGENSPHAIRRKTILIQFITIVQIFHRHITISFKDKHHTRCETLVGNRLRPNKTAHYNLIKVQSSKLKGVLVCPRTLWP